MEEVEEEEAITETIHNNINFTVKSNYLFLMVLSPIIFLSYCV